MVLGISYLAYYNYKVQKDLLLTQLHDNSLNVASSVSSAIERFNDIKSTINIQKLVHDVSFELEIFEFRYLEPDGTIRNSMFKEELGEILASESFRQTINGKRKLDTFFFEIRDFVSVMSIYYPIYLEDALVGIIDLAVDISEYDLDNGTRDSFSILRRQVDVRNLLKSMDGSITNSLTILTKTNINDFLHAYVDSANNIVQVSIIDEKNSIFASSDIQLVSTNLKYVDISKSSIMKIDGKLRYRTIIDSHMHENNEKMKLLLLIDATTYLSHENQLFSTATITAIIALLFALLTSRLIYFSAIEQSRTEKERLEHLVKQRTKEIEILSQIDSLTGLWNRRHLEESLESEFKRAKRYDQELSIIIIDLDHFKNVNDTYGHMAGDEVLRQISFRIKAYQRETDFIGRYGGEEIVVILPETDINTAINVAEGIRMIIEQDPVEFEDELIIVTTSIGVNSLRDDHENYATLFAEADEALYSAKKLGRNRVEVF